MWEFRKGEKYESFKNVSTIYKRRGWNGNRRGDSDHRGNIGTTRYTVFYEEIFFKDSVKGARCPIFKIC